MTYLALTTNNGEAKRVGLLVDLMSLDTSTHLDSGSRVAGALIVGDVVNVLQVVGPDTQSTSTGGLAIEIVASVLDNQTETSVTSKVHSQLDLSNVGDIDSVAAVATNRAGSRGIGSGQASAALEEGPHHRGSIGGAGVELLGHFSLTYTMSVAFNLLQVGVGPVISNGRASRGIILIRP
jgi:hypothetical protein